MKTEMVKVSQLQVGDKVQGADQVWEVIKHVLPFNEGDTYLVIFKNIETGEELNRYLSDMKRFTVLTP